MLTSLSDIRHAFYINLEHRTDRREQIEEELQKININAQRFNAIRVANGAVGCTISHIKLLENAIHNNYPHLLILEDDIQFLEPEIFKNSFNHFIQSHGNSWDVIIFSGNSLRSYGNLVIVKHNNSYISVYAHNSKNLVKEGDTIKRGQKIAEMGNSETDRVKLHFELRRESKPIDPSGYFDN